MRTRTMTASTRAEYSLQRWGARVTLQRSPIKRGQFQGISKYKSAQNTIFMD